MKVRKFVFWRYLQRFCFSWSTRREHCIHIPNRRCQSQYSFHFFARNSLSLHHRTDTYNRHRKLDTQIKSLEGTRDIISLISIYIRFLRLYTLHTCCIQPHIVEDCFSLVQLLHSFVELVKCNQFDSVPHSLIVLHPKISFLLFVIHTIAWIKIISKLGIKSELRWIKWAYIKKKLIFIYLLVQSLESSWLDERRALRANLLIAGISFPPEFRMGKLSVVEI